MTVTSEKLKAFNEYLGNSGSDFVDDPELSRYYSIPYILTTDDTENMELEFLFEKEFIEELESMLNSQLEAMSEGVAEDAGNHSLLEEMASYYIKHSTENQGKVEEKDTALDDVHRIMKDLTNDIRELTKESEAKKYALNVIASKYERLRFEYEQFKRTQEQEIIVERDVTETIHVMTADQHMEVIEKEKKLKMKGKAGR